MASGSDKLRNITTSSLNRLPKYSSNSFQPTDAHRRAKSAFWAHYFSTGSLPPTDINLATAAELSGFSTELQEWWPIEGFQEWFSNGEEFRQRVEYLSNAALDVLQEILYDRAARTSDKLQAAKMALEIAAKFPKSTPKEQFADEAIGEMTAKELEEFISRKLKVLPLPQQKTVDIQAEPADNSTITE